MCTQPENKHYFLPQYQWSFITSNELFYILLINWVFSYKILAGVTEYESYHLLDSISLVHGMLENEQHKVLLDYMKAKFEVTTNFFKNIFEPYQWHRLVFSLVKQIIQISYH
jgi:hypothetical protein